MTTPSPTQTPRRPAWRRKLLYISGGLLVLFVATYFIVTSSGFFKAVILPRVSKAIGGEVAVAKASISPFSQVTLRQLTFKTTGAEPLLQAEEVRLRYSLFAIMGGTLKVDEVTLTSPVVQIIENADGTSNLDPLMKGDTKPASQPAPAPSKTPQIDLKNFALKNATVRRIKNLKGGGREAVELTGVNITLDQLKNGQPGKLTTAASLKMTGPTNDVLEAKSTGQIDFTLGPDLMPQSIKAKVEQEVLRAEGSLRELAGARTLLTGDVTPTEIKEFSQRFLRGEQLLGEVKVSGPLDLAKKEGRLKLEIVSIDRKALNLIGAPLGLDFGATTVNATTDLSLTQGGTVITANTRFDLAKFSLTQNGQTTPALDLRLVCNVTANTGTESAQVQILTLDGTQNQQPLLRASLSKPMSLAWGNSAAAAGDSTFDLVITDFDLAPWKPFLGDETLAGRLSAQANLISEQGGKQLKLGLTSQIAGLAVRLGDKPLTQASLALKFNGQLNDFIKVNLSEYRLDLTQQAQPALTVTGSAGYDGAAFNLRTHVEAVMARLTGSGPATPLSMDARLDGSFTNQVLDLRQLQIALTPTQRAPKNELTLTGRVDLSTPGTTKGHLTARADTLELTQLYDAFAGQTGSPTAPPPSAGTPAPATPPAGSTEALEPDPVTLPFQFTVETSLGQVYLREMAMTNWQTTVKVDGSKVTIDPCRLALNGAPVDANVNLNLGVKGYTYALSLRMDKVPLEPIANTFAPETRGQYQGNIVANAQIKGAGVTDASLRKNLGGQVGFTFTNANIQLAGPKAKRLIVPIATLLRVNEVSHSPLNWLDAQTEIGDGNIKLNGFAVQSEAFEARTQGVIPMAEVLTNSALNLPVEFALRRSLAEKSSLLPANAPTNTTYVGLPKFVSVKGTLGDPKSELNELALGGLLLKSGVGIAEKLGVKIDPKTGKTLQDLGELLTGPKPATTNQLGTNQPPTNARPRLNPLDLLKKPKE